MTFTALDLTLQAFQIKRAHTPSGVVQFRHAGGRPPAQATHVLLHGIGSGSASWVAQLQAASECPHVSLLAWDAPGYGDSAPLSAAQPVAQDYARQMWAWLDALNVRTPFTLVGHSLGALMAASAARLAPQRIAHLVLLAPARGYGHASAPEREAKLADRLNALHTLGPSGMAQQRGAALLSPRASPAQIAFLQSVMAQIKPPGYTQAAHLLSQGDLLADLAPLDTPRTVASGSADTITPVLACQGVAQAAHTAWLNLGDVGHACPLEGGDAVNQLLQITPLNHA